MAYIGAEPDGMGKAQRFTFTASGGETVVSADDDGIPIGYTANQVSVYLNGVKLVVGTGKDCQATNGSTITGLAALAASDVVEVVALSIFSATTVEGTALISTGETGGSKFLREDGDGTSSWQPVTEDSSIDVIQTNIALLGFKVAVNGSLAKYDLQDQIIDEYTTNAGVNTGDSTFEELTGGVYRGENPAFSSVTPTVTHNAGATGTDGDYTWYKYTSTGAVTYSTNTTQDHDFLVIAGGGSGGHGSNTAGGGGAGGYRNSWASEATGGGGSNEAALSFVASTNYTVTVGTGGAAQASNNTNGVDGIPSSIIGGSVSITTVGGGGGGNPYAAGSEGGSGGGGGGYNGYVAGARTANQGYAGGTAISGQWSGAGGGGAGAAGADVPTGNNSSPTNGGVGLTSAIDGTGTFRAGGGGGTSDAGSATSGGNGGGGAGAAVIGVGTAGTANTGGGGGAGGAGASGAGGTGIVIIRRLTAINTPGPDDLILQSSDTTAEAAPTKADMVILVEDAGSGVGTLDTTTGHIKGWVSRYETGNVKTWTQVPLVDEGHWEGGPSGGKRILAAHDVTLTGTSGTQMAYKITTHSASAVYDTRIHATSIGWR